jgi:hypothetical protein
MTVGNAYVCTITNDDIAPTLELNKTVVNDDGGTLTQADFPSFVDGSPQAWDAAAVDQDCCQWQQPGWGTQPGGLPVLR